MIKLSFETARLYNIEGIVNNSGFIDMSSIQILVFFALVIIIAVYVTVTNNKRKQQTIIKSLRMAGESQHKESIPARTMSVYHITLREMQMRTQ